MKVSFAPFVRTLCLAISCVSACTAAYGIGDEAKMSEQDLNVTFDSRWAGNASGGYYPLRFRMTNRAPARDITIVVQRQYEEVPRVQQSVRVDQNATIETTLLVPMVNAATSGELRIYSDGVELKRMRQGIVFPQVNLEVADRPSLIVIAPTNVDVGPFDDAVSALTPSSAHGYGYSVTSDSQQVPPALLPESWLGYSGLDFVAVSLKTLDSLARSYRDPLLKWVETGGTLIVYDIGGPAADSQELDDLLGLSRRDFHGDAWENGQLVLRRPIALPQQAGQLSTEEVLQKNRAGFLWGNRADVFQKQSVMLGSVYGFSGNPFPGTMHDWGWFLNEVGANQYRWSVRNGFSSRHGHDEYLNFLIPGVESVPVFAFLILITGFTVVIGPVNYFYCWKRKQLFLLIVTIPAIALATSLTLFAYSAVSHGFGTKSRMRSVTFLDQQQRTAITISRNALWCGFAPSDGLGFSPQTAVFPLWGSDDEFQTGRVDWTDAQILTGGWLRSRTRTQFVTTTHRIERGRVDVKVVGGAAEVSNGLEHDLEMILVAAEDGVYYFGEGIPAGSVAQLSRATDEELQLLEDRIAAAKPEFPEGVNAGVVEESYTPYGYSRDRAVGFGASLFDRGVEGPRAAGRKVASGEFYAVFQDNPGVDLGLESTVEYAGFHCLIGRYEKHARSR